MFIEPINYGHLHEEEPQSTVDHKMSMLRLDKRNPSIKNQREGDGSVTATNAADPDVVSAEGEEVEDAATDGVQSDSKTHGERSIAKDDAESSNRGQVSRR